MNKEEKHHWGRTLVTAAVIIFACGGYAMKITSNSGNIEKVGIKAEANKDNINTLSSNQKEMRVVNKNIAGTLSRIEAAQVEQTTSQHKIVTDVAVIKTEVANLKKPK